MVVISVHLYQNIVAAIRKFDGLCADFDLRQQFPACDSAVLSSILAREGQYQQKQNYPSVCWEIKRILHKFEQRSVSGRDDVLLCMSIEYKFSPIGLCRLVLAEKYMELEKREVSEMLRNPNKIPDTVLALNVNKCLMNDYLDGPLTDHIRRMVGEEYEILLKKKAKEAGLVFYDEGDLRRTGYDKTPDLKLALPCLYRGIPIQWIESKASFGDMESHQKYIKEQLSSYGNRFGAGVVIYWFGYVESIAKCPQNSNFIFVADHFPTEITLMKITENDV